MKRKLNESITFSVKRIHVFAAAVAILILYAIAIMRGPVNDNLELTENEVQIVYDFVSFMDIQELEPMYARMRNEVRVYGDDEIMKIYDRLHNYVINHDGMSKN